jgi:hypothetical protein
MTEIRLASLQGEAIALGSDTIAALDVRACLVEINAAGLPSTIGEHDNILRHRTSIPTRCVGSFQYIAD